MAGEAIRAEAPLRAKQLLVSSSLDILVKREVDKRELMSGMSFWCVLIKRRKILRLAQTKLQIELNCNL
jgi:hypothetical protein